MPKFVEGQVYLRHKTTGVVYPYDAVLAKNKSVEPYTPEPVAQADASDLEQE